MLNEVTPPNSSDSLSTHEIRVDGKYLVVRSGTVLPEFCVKSNEPISRQDFQTRTLSWCSPFIGLLILLSGLVLILAYFLVRKKCTITFGMAPEKWHGYRLRRRITFVAAAALFFALLFAAGLDSTPLIIVVFVLFLVAIISLFLGNSPLAITKHRNGEFWISGCSRLFLERITSESQQGASAVDSV